MQAVADEQLIQWVANGDSSCLATLFERHHRGVFQFCLQMTRDRALSEDLVQDVFLKLLKNASSFRNDGSFRAWMFHIARNVTLDQLRKSQRQKSESIEGDTAEDGLTDHRSAEQSAAGSQSMQRVVQALSEMPASAQEVIWLGRFELDSYQELGLALDCSAGAARVRMHRAMALLNSVYIRINGEPIDV